MIPVWLYGPSIWLMHSASPIQTPSFLQGIGFDNFYETTNSRFSVCMYPDGFFEELSANTDQIWRLGTVTDVGNQSINVRHEFGQNRSLYSGYSWLNNSQFKRELPYQKMTVGGVGVRCGRSMFASAGIERWQKRKDYLSRIS